MPQKISTATTGIDKLFSSSIVVEREGIESERELRRFALGVDLRDLCEALFAGSASRWKPGSLTFTSRCETEAGENHSVTNSFTGKFRLQILTILLL
jgi:hypothetical protein